MAAVPTVAPPGVFSGTANVIAVGVLLLEFGMFRQALLRDQVRLYAAQAGLISVLAVVVAAVRHLPDLYALAGLSFALKVVIVPVVLRRLLRGLGARGEGPGWTDIAGSGSLGLASHRAAGHRRGGVRGVQHRGAGPAQPGAAGHRAVHFGGGHPGGLRADDRAPGRGVPGDRLASPWRTGCR